MSDDDDDDDDVDRFPPGTVGEILEGPFHGFRCTVIETTFRGLRVEVSVFERSTVIAIEEKQFAPEVATLSAERTLALAERCVDDVLQARAVFHQTVRWANRVMDRSEWTDAELATIDDDGVEADATAEIEALRADPSRAIAWIEERAAQQRLAYELSDEDRARFGDNWSERLRDGARLRDRTRAIRRRGGDPTPIATNPALESQIDLDPDKVDAYAVYGDWLQAENDPRGELVALQTTERRSAPFVMRHHGYLFGGLDPGDGVVAVEWRWGFMRRAKVMALREHEAQGIAQAPILAKLLALPSARFLRELVVGCASCHEDGVATAIVDAFVRGGMRPTLARLEFETDESEEMLSWTETGALAPIWPLVPALRSLRLKAGSIGIESIALPELRELSIETCGLSEANVHTLVEAAWPHLGKLELWFGSTSRAATSPIEAARKLELPAIRDLGFVNTEDTDALCEALPSNPAWHAIESLDLSKGTMTDPGAAALLRALPPGLRRLDVSANYLSDDAVRAFDRPGLVVAAGEQRVAEVYEGEEHRYCDVVE